MGHGEAGLGDLRGGLYFWLDFPSLPGCLHHITRHLMQIGKPTVCPQIVKILSATDCGGEVLSLPQVWVLYPNTYLIVMISPLANHEPK